MSDNGKTLTAAQMRFRRGVRAFLTSAAIMLGAFLLYDWATAWSRDRNPAEAVWGVLLIAAGIASLVTWSRGSRDEVDGIAADGIAADGKVVTGLLIKAVGHITQLEKDLEALDLRVSDLEAVTKDL